MQGPIATVLMVTAALTAALAAGLAVVKFVHREVQRYRGVRIAYYTAAIGEMVSRSILPSRPRPGWAHDPYFHEALGDYHRMVTGPDREVLDELAARLGITQRLASTALEAKWTPNRLRALSALVDLATPEQRDVFRRLIHDRNPHVRVNAVRGLARIEDVESVPMVLDMASRMRQWEASRAIDALVDMGADAVEPVITWMRSRRAETAQPPHGIALAARLVGLLGHPAAEQVMVELLGSTVTEWKIAAASALEHVGGPDAVEPLRLAIHDDDWRVRARAVVALGALADSSVLPEISQLLTDRQWWVRQNAATALARQPNGRRFLEEAVDGNDPYASDAALTALTSRGLLAARI
ncbi:MAG: HEAT repeat domain-containing protein [Acidimicrobiia bacterium]|nr:HEAT repeat domain-containing protein [Acidimicrobiia bacterium]